MITPATSEVIDAWVAEQMLQPWPLSSTQLELIKRTLRFTQTTAGVKRTPDAAA